VTARRNRAPFLNLEFATFVFGGGSMGLNTPTRRATPSPPSDQACRSLRRTSRRPERAVRELGDGAGRPRRQSEAQIERALRDAGRNDCLKFPNFRDNPRKGIWSRAFLGKVFLSQTVRQGRAVGPREETITLSEGSSAGLGPRGLPSPFTALFWITRLCFAEKMRAHSPLRRSGSPGRN
jgi:hypothetical protein